MFGSLLGGTTGGRFDMMSLFNNRPLMNIVYDFDL
jgi:hypothetical protein